MGGGDMQVTVVSSTTVYGRCSPAAPSVVPLTIFDKFASNMHVGVVYAFAAPTASNDAIKDALLETLTHFPTLTGRIGDDNLGRPCIHIGGHGGGTLLVEATVASTLADHLPLKPSPELLKLHPPTEGADHLLQVQLNRFRCGGLVVGATSHHRVSDGHSMSNFFFAWGKSVRGVTINPPPFHDCHRWLQPRHPPRCEFQHWGVEFVPRGLATNSNSLAALLPSEAEKIHNVSLHYSSEFIQKSLKARMRERYTTFECLLAHVWRKITMARGLDGEQFTQIHVAVNGRRRLKPPVPAEFFGNLVLNACPRAKANELLVGGVERAAMLIHEAVLRTGDDYFRSFVDFGSMNEGEHLKPILDDAGMVLHPDLEVDSWLWFHFNDMDFGGGGGPCAFAPTWIPAEGVVIFLPPFDGDGVDVIITLFQEDANLLRKISHSLE